MFIIAIHQDMAIKVFALLATYMESFPGDTKFTIPIYKFREFTDVTAYKVSIFGVILVRIFPHSDCTERYGVSASVQMRENTDQNHSEYEHFSRSA